MKGQYDTILNVMSLGFVALIALLLMGMLHTAGYSAQDIWGLVLTGINWITSAL